MKKTLLPLFALGLLALVAAPGRSQELDPGSPNPNVDLPPSIELPAGVPDLPLQGPLQIRRPDLVPTLLPGVGKFGVLVKGATGPGR